MGKLPSQPEYIQKESCQAITLRSSKEVEGDVNKKKSIVDEDDGVEIEEVYVSNKNDEKSEKKSKNLDTMPPKEDEPKVDLKTLPFPQRYIRRSLDKQFGKFLNLIEPYVILVLVLVLCLTLFIKGLIWKSLS